MQRQSDTKDEESIQWHNAFCAATELELADNADVLNFHREYILGKEPLWINMLVIQVRRGAVLKSEIAEDFFKGHNIIEYKSPGDEVNIDTAYKILAYAALYKAETGKYVDEVKDDDITITFMREAKPLKLFKVFRRRLSHQYRSVREHGTKADRQNAETVMDLASHASNTELAEEVKGDGIMTIMDVAVPVIEEEREKAREWLIRVLEIWQKLIFNLDSPERLPKRLM